MYKLFLKNKQYLSLVSLGMILLLSNCSGGGDSSSSGDNENNEENSTTTEYIWDLPEGFPTPNIPSNNPMSEEKVTLGRYLFYDNKLSGNYTYSCASCHHQEKAFSDGLSVAIGSTGELHPRNAQSLVNVAYNATLTWANPSLTELEQHMSVPMFGEFPIEMGITGVEAEVLARIQADPVYQDLFFAAFPETEAAITYENIIKAIASFIRTMISGNSPL